MVFPDFRLHHSALVTEMAGYWLKLTCVGQWNRTEDPDTSECNSATCFLTNMSIYILKKWQYLQQMVLRNVHLNKQKNTEFHTK